MHQLGEHPEVVSLQGSTVESQLLCAAQETVVRVGGVRAGGGVTGLSLVAFLLGAFKPCPLLWERHNEETEAHREEQSHKGPRSQNRNLYFPSAASQETFGIPPNGVWGASSKVKFTSIRV